MSAIAGFAWHDGHEASRADLDAMMRALAHRGTDGSGAWVDGPVALGHRMRWSTPESLGERLPLVTIEGDIRLTSDGRIDNRDELAASLAVPVPDRATIPDSALIALAYRKWGEACPEHLIGDFAFVIWDARERRLMCAVDAFGSVPLYYACPPDRFAFASEAKALHALPGVPRRLNDARFADRGVIGLSFLDKEATFFEGIRHVPPAHTLTVRHGEARLRRYWDPASVPPPDFRSDDDFVDAMRDRFTEAVRCRLRSAYPVASLLSGGLDSSTIATVAARELAATGRRLLTISSVLPADHPGPERDERPSIDAVTQNAGIDWIGVPPHVDLFATLADEFFWTERPSSPRHDIYHGLYEAARDGGARTLLDGLGGELGMTAPGNGYLLHLFTSGRWLRLAREVHAGSRVQGVSGARHAYRHLVHPLLSRRRTRIEFADVTLAQSPLAAEMMSRYRLRERLAEQAAENARRLFRGARDDRAYVATRMQRPLMAHAEAFGTRVTLPFKDRRVVELSLHLPESLTTYRGYRRGLVRRAFDGVLPPVIQWRRDKTAFSPDYYQRLRASRNQMRDEIESVRADDAINGYLDIAKMRSTLDALSEAPDWSRGVPGLPGDPAALLLDAGLILLHFLRWSGAATNAAY